MFGRTHRWTEPTEESRSSYKDRQGIELRSDTDVPCEFAVPYPSQQWIRAIFIPGSDHAGPKPYSARIYLLTREELRIFGPVASRERPTVLTLSGLGSIHSFKAQMYGALEFESDLISQQFFYHPVQHGLIDSFLRNVRRHWLTGSTRSVNQSGPTQTASSISRMQAHLLNSELDPDERLLDVFSSCETARPGSWFRRESTSLCLALTERRLILIASDEGAKGIPSYVSIRSARPECIRVLRQKGKLNAINIEVQASTHSLRPGKVMVSADGAEMFRCLLPGVATERVANIDPTLVLSCRDWRET